MTRHEERPLTTLERRVAKLVAAGRTDAEVAAELGLGVRTVGWHLARTLRKLGVRSRSELAAVIARGDRPIGEGSE